MQLAAVLNRLHKQEDLYQLHKLPQLYPNKQNLVQVYFIKEVGGVYLDGICTLQGKDKDKAITWIWLGQMGRD